MNDNLPQRQFLPYNEGVKLQYLKRTYAKREGEYHEENA
jgi:hypothetical protein